MLRSRISSSIVAALAAVLALPTHARAQSIDVAAWMAGCWEQAAGSRVTHEQWMAPRGGLMMGMSRTVVRDTAREFEHLRIESRAGRVAYVAHPSGQAEAAFPATLLSDTLVIFDNPAHDFPQRISYRRLSRDSVVARIEGTNAQQQRRASNFPMRRVACGGEGR
jgi:hypothetical protein